MFFNYHSGHSRLLRVVGRYVISVDSNDVPWQEYCDGDAEEACHAHGDVTVLLQFFCGPFCILQFVFAPPELFDFDVEAELHSGRGYQKLVISSVVSKCHNG